MLKAIPRSWFSYDFDVYDRTGERVGHVDLSNWRENAKLEVGGKHYEATHRSGRKEFVLSRRDGSTVLVAEKPSAWKERLSFEYAKTSPPTTQTMVIHNAIKEMTNRPEQTRHERPE